MSLLLDKALLPHLTGCEYAQLASRVTEGCVYEQAVYVQGLSSTPSSM